MPKSSKNRVYYFCYVFLAEFIGFPSENLSDSHPLTAVCWWLFLRSKSGASSLSPDAGRIAVSQQAALATLNMMRCGADLMSARGMGGWR